MSRISPHAQVGLGTAVGYYCEVGPEALIGRNCRLEHCTVEGEIGNRTKVWRYAHVMQGAQIGDDCMIGQGVFVADAVLIGDRVKIQNHTNVSRNAIIGNDVYIGAGVQFCNSRHPNSAGTDTLEPITVCDGASIGSNVCILGGVTIGPHAVVGCGAVVAVDVAEGSTVMGVPAKMSPPEDWDQSGVCGG